MSLRIIGILAIFLLPFLAENTMAQEDKEMKRPRGPKEGVFLSFGAMKKTREFRQEEEKAQFLPMINFVYGRYFLKGLILGVDMIKWEGLKISLIATPEMKSYKEDNLSERKKTGLIGIESQYSLGLISFQLSLLNDFLGRHNGKKGHFLVGVRVPFSNDFFMRPEIGIEFNDKKYSNYYYGVSEEEAFLPETPVYKAGTAISFQSSLMASYSFSEKWSVINRLGYKLFHRDIRTSPLVGRRGVAQMFLGVSYTF